MFANVKTLVIQDDNFTKSLFQAISETNSNINILIGSKKFIEGWNSWRVSSMGLMNMGKSEGAQIIQLFGRGVRLKGKNFSLKREEANAPYFIRALQNISIMGLNASYMNRFLVEIENEVPEYTEYPIEIKLNNEEKWNGQIMTFRKQKDRNFKEEIVELDYNSQIAKRVTIDLRNKVSIAAGGFNSQVAEDSEPYFENFLKQFINFIDLDALVLEANRYKLIKGYGNLIIKATVIQQLIIDGNFNTKILPSIYFDKHLYSPISSIADGKKYKEIKTVPTRLNEGERDFLKHLREFVKEKNDLFEGKELFVLRNLSVKGIGFFMESSSFYPDFILWVVDKNKQYIYFLDPKGILLGDNHFNNPKVLWCKESAPNWDRRFNKN